MPKELDFKHLRMCIDNFEADQLFIRLMGSYGGTIKVNEKLEGRVLDFKKNDLGLYILIDNKEMFHFPLKDGYYKGFSLAYERFDEKERPIILISEKNPYDSELPEPKNSFLRQVFDNHLFELYFKGRIDIKFHSWWNKPHSKYWEIDLNRKKP